MMETALFYIFGGISLIAAISVVLQKRVFYSAISLIVCLGAVAVIYLLLESPFIAAVQIIVYAGAIMVLFLFVIMLLDPFSMEALRDKKKILGYGGALLGVLTLAIILPLLQSYNSSLAFRRAGDTTESYASMHHLGLTLFKEYLLPFEATSVLILAAIIGVVVLAKRRP